MAKTKEQRIRQMESAIDLALDLLNNEEFLFTRGNPAHMVKNINDLKIGIEILKIDDEENEPFIDDLTGEVFDETEIK